MAGYTPHYGLQKLSAGDQFSLNSYKFTNDDPDQEDALMWLGAEGHHHTGSTTGTGPSTGPQLTLHTTGGTLPAGVTLYYEYTLTNAAGQESSASAQTSVSTPAAVATPAAPGISTTTTGGTLLTGNYYYVLSAYQTSNTIETKALNPTYITVPATTLTNKITLTLPALPSGATGFNVYRRKPNGIGYFYLASINMAVATPPTTFDDTGLSEDCNRALPTVNSTNSTNSVTVCIPGATPTTPVGYTWSIYRTTVSGSYTNSFLIRVTTQTIPGIIDACYLDTGLLTGAGQPPLFSQFTTTPTKIQFTDSAEIQGTAPMGRVSGYPFIIELFLPGSVTTGLKGWIWVCEFPKFYINTVRLTVGTAPSSSVTIVDVNKLASSATPTATTIFTTIGNRPNVPNGWKRGPSTVPDIRNFVLGDALNVNVIQAGGGPPADLTVLIYGFAYGFDPTTSFVGP